jgi:hypothetical protein
MGSKRGRKAQKINKPKKARPKRRNFVYGIFKLVEEAQKKGIPVGTKSVYELMFELDYTPDVAAERFDRILAELNYPLDAQRGFATRFKRAYTEKDIPTLNQLSWLTRILP